LTLHHLLVLPVTTILHNLLLGYLFVRFCVESFRCYGRQTTLKMEKHEVRPVIKYLYLKGITPLQIFSDIGETLGESAPAYSTVAKWHAEFNRLESVKSTFVLTYCIRLL